MNTEFKLFCEMITLALHPGRQPEYSAELKQQVSDKLPALLEIARKHKLLMAFLDGLLLLNLSPSDDLRPALHREVLMLCESSYHMLDFARSLLTIMKEEQVTYYLLKGITLLPCYPKPEYRSFGDIDIFIPNPSEFERIKNRLVSEGFQAKETFAEHHIELVCLFRGRPCCLELHSKVIADKANAKFNRKVHNLYAHITPVAEKLAENDVSFCVLPHTENAVYLLLHMLQHLLSSGFGMKLLCDWYLYLTHYGSRIDLPSFHSIIADLGLQKFCNTVTLACQTIGMTDDAAAPFLSGSLPDEEYLRLFQEEIFVSGEYGHDDDSRMSVMAQGGRLSKYFYELNVQMKRRFHRLGKIIPLYPVLWIITILCFLWNNRFVRHVNTRDILATADKRSKLINELHLYE